MIEQRVVRVLVADDDDAVRLALAELIGDDPGFDVVAIAANATEAVALAGEHRPDLAVLDVRMPGGGGPEAARGIGEVSPATRVVACSAYDDPGSRSLMGEAGVVGYVAKGAGLSELMSTLRAAAGLAEDGSAA